MGSPPKYPYDPDVAVRLLNRLGAGGRIEDLVREPGFPSRHGIAQWRRARPDFDRGMDIALSYARSLRRSPYAYDEGAIGRLEQRLRAGELLRDLVREPGMPGLRALKRWRRQSPGLGARLRAAIVAGVKVRGQRFSKFTPEIGRRICALTLLGLSMRAIGRLPGMPRATQVCVWMRDHPDFAWDVAVARDYASDLAGDAARALIAGLDGEAAARAARPALAALIDGRRTPRRWSVDLILAEQCEAERRKGAAQFTGT